MAYSSPGTGVSLPTTDDDSDPLAPKPLSTPASVGSGGIQRPTGTPGASMLGPRASSASTSGSGGFGTNLDGLTPGVAADETNDKVGRMLYGNFATSAAASAAPAVVGGNSGGSGSQLSLGPRTTTPAPAAGASPMFTGTRSVMGDLTAGANAIKTAATGALAKIPVGTKPTPDFFTQQGMALPDANLAAYHATTYGPAQAAVSTAQMAHDKFLDSLPDPSNHLLPLSARVNRFGIDPSSLMNEGQATAYGATKSNLQDTQDALALLQPHYDQLVKSAHETSVANQAQTILDAQGDAISVPQPAVKSIIASPKPTAAASGATSPTVATPVSRASTFLNANGDTVQAPAGITATRDANGNPVFTGTGATVAAAGGVQPDTVSGANLARTNTYTPGGSTVPGSSSADTDGSLFGPRSDFGTPLASVGSSQNLLGSRNVPAQVQPDTDTYATRQADADRQKQLSDIDSAIFRAGIGGERNRGTRQLTAGLFGAKAALVGGEGQEATQRADAGVQAGVAGQAQEAESGRDDANNATAMQRDTQDNLFKRDLSQTDLDHQPIIGADGALYVRHGGSIFALRGEDGKPFKPASGSDDGELKTLAETYAKLLETMKPVDADKTPTGRAYMQALAKRGEAPTAPRNPTPDDITMLKADPTLAQKFDQKFGTGAAKQVLGK